MKYQTFLALALVFFLGACGGGDDPPPPEPAPPVAFVLGKAHLSSPLVGAHIEVQSAQGERVAMAEPTNASGVFTLPLPASHQERVRVVASGGTYEGQPFDGRLLLEVENLSNQSELYVNAATTLVGRYIDRHPGTSIAEASSIVKQFLQIPEGASLGSGVANPHQYHFRHDKLLEAVPSGSPTGLNDYLDGLVTAMGAGSPLPSLARQPMLGSAGEWLEKLLDFLGEAALEDTFSLGMEAFFTNVGIDGTADILRELHEMQHQLDELSIRTHELLVESKDTKLEILTTLLAKDISEIKTMYNNVTLLVESIGPVCKPDDAACQANLRLMQGKVRTYRAAILNGSFGSTKFEDKLALIHDTLLQPSPSEPGLLMRANDLVRTKNAFDVPAQPGDLVKVKEFYQAYQGMAVHLLTEAYKAREPAANASKEDIDALKADNKAMAKQLLDDFENKRLKAQEDRMEELRYKRADTMRQVSNGLVWLRAPYNNLPPPQDLYYEYGIYESDYHSQASRLCRNLASSGFSGLAGWRNPTKEEFHQLVLDGSDGEGESNIFESLIRRGFERAPYQTARGIFVAPKSAYLSETWAGANSYEALWSRGVDWVYKWDGPVGDNRATNHGAWCVSQDSGGE
ncbi:hypothetical protein [Ottowia caeni]|uniref:hypothetical protein n=1 Tax=Ottowia caeni TaxID=2870339 RepID=UPI001E2B1771|nr:hypothetical protein [Ottowia caeni]